MDSCPFIEDHAFGLDERDERAVDVSEALRFLGRVDEDIERPLAQAEDLADIHSPLPRGLGAFHLDEEVNVALGIRIAARA